MADETALINRTLQILIGDTDQAGERESAMVRDYIPAKVAELSVRGVVQIVDPNDFPDEYLHWLALLLASDLSPSFGKAIDPVAIELAERRLFQLTTAPAAISVLKTDYF